LKDQVNDFEGRGFMRRGIESNKDAGIITQAIGYLDDFVKMFQASPATSIQRVPDYLPHGQLDTGLHTEANTELILGNVKRIEESNQEILRVRVLNDTELI
jgi:hypothetical protein